MGATSAKVVPMRNSSMVPEEVVSPPEALPAKGLKESKPPISSEVVKVGVEGAEEPGEGLR